MTTPAGEGRSTTSRPIDVPSITHDTSFLTLDRPIVGSPEQDNLLARPLSVNTNLSIEHPNYTRPILERRSVSFPNRFTPSSRQPNQSREHEWTLFGQMMDTGLRDTESRRDRKRTSYNMSSAERVPVRLSSTSDLGDSASRVQSPVEDLPPIGDGMPAHASSDYDSDDSVTSKPSKHPSEVETAPRWYSTQCLPTLSTLHRNIIKCAVAYFIASLFTFSPYLSSFISDITSDNEPGQSPPSPAGHMVATM